MKKAIIQGKLWGKSPNGWAEIQEQQHKPLWKAMLDETSVGAGTIFLDVGCGAGGASALAKVRGAEIYGVDVAAALLSLAKLRIPDGNFLVGDMENLPYEDNRFDVIFAANSLQYAENRVAALQEFKRICKPGGRIIAAFFGEPEKVEFNAVFNALRNAMPGPPQGGGPFELSMPGMLEGLFTEAGLTNNRVEEVNCPFTYGDFSSFWYGNASAGPFQRILQMVDEDELKLRVRKAIGQFLLDDGSILIPKNIFKYISAFV